MKRWKAWEKETQTTEYQVANGNFKTTLSTPQIMIKLIVSYELFVHNEIPIDFALSTKYTMTQVFKLSARIENSILR